MATETQVKKLAAALSRAKECAFKHSETEDSGSSNFDTPQIFLQGWRQEDVSRAFEMADLRCYIEKSKNILVVDIYGCTEGQGYRRTRMAESVRNSLRNDGYEAFVYYRMD